MTWTRFESESWLHPKLVAAGPMAELLHYRACQWSNGVLTDGAIPKEVLPLLGRGIRRPERSAEALRREGIWHDPAEAEACSSEICGRGRRPAEGGWLIHDFLEYQPSRTEVLEKRAVRLSVARAGGLARAQAAVRTESGTFARSGAQPEASRAAGPSAGSEGPPEGHENAKTASRDPASDPAPTRPDPTTPTTEGSSVDARATRSTGEAPVEEIPGPGDPLWGPLSREQEAELSDLQAHALRRAAVANAAFAAMGPPLLRQLRSELGDPILTEALVRLCQSVPESVGLPSAYIQGIAEEVRREAAEIDRPAREEEALDA